MTQAHVTNSISKLIALTVAGVSLSAASAFAGPGDDFNRPTLGTTWTSNSGTLSISGGRQLVGTTSAIGTFNSGGALSAASEVVFLQRHCPAIRRHRAGQHRRRQQRLRENPVTERQWDDVRYRGVLHRQQRRRQFLHADQPGAHQPGRVGRVFLRHHRNHEDYELNRRPDLLQQLRLRRSALATAPERLVRSDLITLSPTPASAQMSRPPLQPRACRMPRTRRNR